MKRQDGGDPLAVEGVANGVPVPVTISGGGGGGGPVTIADGADVAEGATTDAAVVTDTTGTVSGKLRGLVKWAFERMPASLGAKVSASSFPVVLASDQAAVPVSGTVTAIQGTATSLKTQAETYQGGTAVGAANPLQVSLANTGANAIALLVTGTGGSFPVSGSVTVVQPTGTNLHTVVDSGSITATQATGTNLHTVIDSGTITTVSTVTSVTAIASALPAGNNNIGDVDVATLPALVAGTALIGKVGIDQTTPGTTNGVSIPAIAVTSAVTSVNDSGSSTQLLASTATRKGYKLYNDSTQIGYVKEGTTATTSDYSYQMAPNGYYESVGVGVYTGRIDCIWAADGSGAMKITELT